MVPRKESPGEDLWWNSPKNNKRKKHSLEEDGAKWSTNKSGMDACWTWHTSEWRYKKNLKLDFTKEASSSSGKSYSHCMLVSLNFSCVLAAFVPRNIFRVREALNTLQMSLAQQDTWLVPVDHTETLWQTPSSSTSHSTAPAFLLGSRSPRTRGDSAGTGQ